MATLKSPLPCPFLSGEGTTLRGGSQPPFFFVGLAVGLARSPAAPLLRRSEGRETKALLQRADELCGRGRKFAISATLLGAQPWHYFPLRPARAARLQSPGRRR